MFAWYVFGVPVKIPTKNKVSVWKPFGLSEDLIQNALCVNMGELSYDKGPSLAVTCFMKTLRTNQWMKALEDT